MLKNYFIKFRSYNLIIAFSFFLLFSFLEGFCYIFLKICLGESHFLYFYIRLIILAIIKNIIIISILGGLISIFFYCYKRERKIIPIIFQVLFFSQLFFFIFSLLSSFLVYYIVKNPFKTFQLSLFILDLFNISELIFILYLLIVGMSIFIDIPKNKIFFLMIVPYSLYGMYFWNAAMINLYFLNLFPY